MKKIIKCKKCKKEMKKRGFEGHNLRYECDKCNIRFIPFKSAVFGNFLGYPRWNKIPKETELGKLTQKLNQEKER